jgi:signal transduction histidine kinase
VPRRGALGLRGRIVGAVIVTTVATLVVAALTLLGPLEHKLRDAEYNTFKRQLDPVATAPFLGINMELAQDYKQPPPTLQKHANAFQRRTYAQALNAYHDQIKDAKQAHAALLAQEAALENRIAASEVSVWGDALAVGQFGAISGVPPESDVSSNTYGVTYAAAYAAYNSRRLTPRYERRTIDGTQYALAAIPFRSASTGHLQTPWVLVVRRPFVEVNDAVHTVRTAFLDAALAGLALTSLLAIPLSFTLVRRLRRLRHAALELAEGRSRVDFPTDRARDEVGDLARTFGLMQTQLRQQEEARRAFVATASHELRTPLTSLEGMLELLEEDLAGPNPDVEDARSLVARARAQSHRLGRLAADLLDLSRIDAQVTLRSEPVELGELSRAVMAEFELGTAERRIASELHEPGTPVWALGDPGSVARILRILLDNAVRVSPPESEIVVELHAGDHAALSVRDHGPGVPPEERELIFQRFQRGRSTSGQAGFGLGLAIGRELAQRMGGELVLEETPRPGATFTLRLPVATAPYPDAVGAF